MKKAYQCDHCGEFFLKSSKSVAVHELCCPHNERNRTCDTCKHIYCADFDDNDQMVFACDATDGEYKWQANCEEWNHKSEINEK